MVHTTRSFQMLNETRITICIVQTAYFVRFIQAHLAVYLFSDYLSEVTKEQLVLLYCHFSLRKSQWQKGSVACS